MAKWESHRHAVGDRTFVVLEHMTDSVMVNGVATGSSEVWRTVEDARTGEVVREFKAPQGMYGMPPYEFAEGQQWLENRYAKKSAVAYAQNSVTWSSGLTVTAGVGGNAGNHSHVAASSTYVTKEELNKLLGVKKAIVPDDAEYFEKCRYAGNCAHCGARIAKGSPIWWRRDEMAMRSYIWCGNHKTIPATAVEEKNEDEDYDMAQRQDFTFPYSGAEIAASLERKAAKLDAQIQPALKVDIETLKLAGYTTERSQKDFMEEAEAKRVKVNQKLADEAAALRKEAIPYAKASKMSFEIDLEDIEFFGLNDDDAPQTAPRKRTRRTKEQIEADKAAAAA